MTETQLAAWELTSVSCVDTTQTPEEGAAARSEEPLEVSPTAEIAITSGADVTCTFVNEARPDRSRSSRSTR